VTGVASATRPVPREALAAAAPPRLSVVVCAFSIARLDLTVASVAALLAQDPAPDEVLVVVDYNEPLSAMLAERIVGATILRNEGPRGLSGGRNTGLSHSSGELVAFVDDDAEVAPGWSAALKAPFRDAGVVAVGGMANPHWDHGAPDWFPAELLWAVGCSYRGMAIEGDVRNPLGCNMAFRAAPVREAGSFDPALGRLGTLPFGCEETELCVRLRRADRGVRIVMAPEAVVSHHVPPERGTLRYLWRRSYYEGVGKSIMRRSSGGTSIGTETSYALKVLPRAVLGDLAGLILLRRPGMRARRIAAIVGSLGLAALGYGVGLATRPAGPAVAVQKQGPP
jgi:cellulose synthase/poly-beta-1,6-N-acetylglucosamine synthase-like glycosyltransferase